MAGNGNVAARRCVYAGKDAQQGGFTGAVMADEAKLVAVRNLEIYVVERAHHDVTLIVPIAPDQPPSGPAEEILAPTAMRTINREVDGNVVQNDRGQDPGFLRASRRRADGSGQRSP